MSGGFLRSPPQADEKKIAQGKRSAALGLVKHKNIVSPGGATDFLSVSNQQDLCSRLDRPG
jgi:hypothetical protein